MKTMPFYTEGTWQSAVPWRKTFSPAMAAVGKMYVLVMNG